MPPDSWSSDSSSSGMSSFLTSSVIFTITFLAGDKELAVSALKVAESEMMRAAQKGVFHKNKAARLKSRLTKMRNSME